MRIVILNSLLYICVSLWSQESAVLPEAQRELDSGASAKSYFCVPGIENKSRSRGVEILYNVTGGGDILDRDKENNSKLGQLQSFEQLHFKLYIPLLLKPDWKVLLGYAYQPERFRFGNLEPGFQPLVNNFQNRFLRSNSYSLTSSKSLNDHNYIGIRAKIAFNGDYKQWMNFETRYQTLNVISVFGIKKNEDFEWGVGVYYSKNMRRSLVLPFAMLHKNFNDKWGVEVAPPAYVYGRYNINKKSMILFGGEYSSRIYSFDTQQLDARSMPIEYTMNHGEINTLISMERQLMPWVWFSIKGGYQFSIRSRLETEAIPDANLRVNLPNSPFFQMAIFLSPPDQMK